MLYVERQFTGNESMPSLSELDIDTGGDMGQLWRLTLQM
jgi:hypothetical protein